MPDEPEQVNLVIDVRAHVCDATRTRMINPTGVERPKRLWQEYADDRVGGKDAVRGVSCPT